MGQSVTKAEVIRLVNRYIGVSAGYLGDFSYRTHADFYAEYCDVDIDLSSHEGTTRERFIKVLTSAEPRDQAAILRGAIERFPVGADGAPGTQTDELAKEIATIADRVEGTASVASPNPRTSSAVVARAIADAEALLKETGATSGVDRVHTALHGHLLAVAAAAGLAVPKDASLAATYRLLLEKHPKLVPAGVRADDIRTVHRSIGAIIGALEPVRNRASVAHPNPVLLDAPEAVLVINVARTILTYVDEKVL
jgi:hypothetical protein